LCLAEVLAATGFPVGVIRLLEPLSGELQAAAVSGAGATLEARLAQPVLAGASPCGLCLQGAGVVVRDPEADPLFAGSPWEGAGFRTFVCRPLEFGDMLLGSLNLASPAVDALTPTAAEALDLLSIPIAAGIANSQLLGTAQRKVHYLAALHESSRDIGQAPGLDQALALIAEHLARLLNLDRTLLYTLESDGVRLARRAASGHPDGLLDEFRPNLTLADRALTGQEVTVLADLGALQAGGSAPAGPFLVVPLRNRGQLQGLLIGARESRPLRLSPNELELAVIFGGQASVWLTSGELLLRERAARAVAEAAQARLRSLLELAPDAILTVDGQGRISLVNSETVRLFGHSREALLGQPIEMLLPERFRAAHVPARDAYLTSPRTRPMGIGLELFGLRADGTEFPVEISLGPTGDGTSEAVLAVIRDVTEQRRDAAERARLLESEQRKSEQLKLAIREAHHRIKNNLQAISDLLYLELGSGSAKAPPDVLRESVERIQSIALVHDLLSQEEDVQTVDTRAMAERLVPMVLRAHGLGPETLALTLDVRAVPLSSRGATRRRSDSLTRRMCSMSPPGRGSKCPVRTSRPESVCSVRGVMNSCALRVMMTVTSHPARRRPRTISADL